jgi:hypothetical protein
LVCSKIVPARIECCRPHALHSLDQPLLVAVGLVVAAAAAAKALGPTRPHQTGPTLLIRAEALEKGRQIPRQVLEQSVGHGVLRSMFLLRS